MTDSGYLRVGCRNHGILEDEITDEDKAKRVKDDHIEETECREFEVQIHDIGFYDHSGRKPDDVDTEEKLNDILGGSDRDSKTTTGDAPE